MGISEDNDMATPGSERIDNEDNETTGEINIEITDAMDSKNRNKLESCETIELQSRESVIDSEPTGSLNDDRNNSYTDQSPPTRLNDFEKRYRKDANEKSFRDIGKAWVRKNCSKQCLKTSLFNTFPFLEIMRGYSPLRDLPSDVIAGITVGIMQIPQGMAYANLATLPPITALYTSFFAPLIYFFLGSSKHASMGTTAVVSLMLGSLLDSAFPADSLGGALQSEGVRSAQSGFSELDVRKIELVTAITLVSGLIMIVLGKLGLGFVTTYMSEHLISGFTTAVGVHVITSQAHILLGLRIARCNGMFKVIKTWIEVFRYIHLTNWLPVVISLVSIVIIYLVKVCINLRFHARLRIPIPIELMVVILSTIVSYFARFEDNFNLRIIGEIPAGIPTPTVPDVSLVSSYIGDAFIIGVIAFAQSVSMAKTLALKSHYTVDADQEMFAYGVGSVLSSFFSGYITAASVARSALQEGAGGKTQVAALSQCCVVLVVIMALGPLLYDLPQCVLASVIIVNLRGILLQFLQLKPLWRKSRYDFWIWVVTFTAAVILDTDVGLLVGVAFSVFSVVVRTQRSSFTKVGQISDSGQFRSEERYDSVQTRADTVTLTFNSPIYFANVEKFKEDCYKLSGVNPRKLKKKRMLDVRASSRALSEEDRKGKENSNNIDVIVDDLDSDTTCSHVIIILTNVSFIDTMGINAIKKIVTDFNSLGVRVSLVGFSESVLDILKSYGFLECMKDNTFLTVSGALVSRHDKTL